MAAVTTVTLPLSRSTGAPTLRISVLPSTPSSEEAIQDFTGEAVGDSTIEPVRLLESVEYRYHLDGGPGGSWTTDHPEVFVPDDDSGCSGRLKTGLFTGAMRVTILSAGKEQGHVAFEVRSRKLDYLSDYRRMLGDIANVATEVVMQHFAPAAATFGPSGVGDPRTLYQRCAFLHSLLKQPDFQAAMAQVLARPYETWESEGVARPVSQGIKAGRETQRHLVGPGQRVPWAGGGTLVSLPQTILTGRTEASVDNVPNQFVRFALSSWRDLVVGMRTALEGEGDTPQVVRGVRESMEIIDILDGILAAPLFREVGQLALFPAGNQVLQKRAGYRDVFRGYIQFELASRLAWDGGEDVFRAGQKNVAQLYEYWAFLQLALTLSRLCERPIDLSSLIRAEDGRLGLALKQGSQSILSGTVRRLGRVLDVSLCYNRTFSGKAQSWTVEMRPDFSVRIEAQGPAAAAATPVWVHFDAKYRIDKVGAFFVADQVAADGPQLMDAVATAKRTDLLKMHAYRDAIRLSAGAYVLYPGDRPHRYSAYSEPLPGLGAFPLKPLPEGDAVGSAELGAFLNELLCHVAHQASEHERARYWARKSFSSEVAAQADAVPFLTKPPADTRILVGYVKSAAHREWIHREGRYNLRADSRPGAVDAKLLDCELLLLHGPGTIPECELWLTETGVENWSRSELIESAYPGPGGTSYYCVRLSRRQTVEGGLLASVRIKAALEASAPAALAGYPVWMTWKELSAPTVDI